MLLAFGTNLLPPTNLIIKPVGGSVEELITCENERRKMLKKNLNPPLNKAKTSRYILL
jgi:hypothetical protein